MAADPHEVLGVRRGASRDEIHRAWLDLARRHHPDRGGDPETMRAVNEAWAALSGAAPAAEPRPRPHGPAPDVEAEEPDWLDPRPYAPAAPRRSAMDLLPASVFAAAIATACLALVLDEPAMLGLAGFLFFLSCVAVAAAAMLSMRRSARAGRR